MEQTNPFPRIPSPTNVPENNDVEAPAPGHSTAPPPGFQQKKVITPVESSIFNFGEQSVLITDKNPLASKQSSSDVGVSDSAVVSASPSSLDNSNNYPFNFMEHVSSLQMSQMRTLTMPSPTMSLPEMNEKTRDLNKRKQRRDRKDKKVSGVIRSEEMEGYQGDKDVNELLASLGETLEEGKKQKVKKPKEQRKDKKKRSVEKTSSSEEFKEELEQEEEETKEDQRTTTETDSTRNVVASNLQDFSKNFNLVYSDNLEEASLRASEGLNQSTESLNFVQVTGKKKGRKVKDEGKKLKDYKRSKEDPGRPPPTPGGGTATTTRERRFSGENRRTSNYALRSRDVGVAGPADETGGDAELTQQPDNATDTFPTFDIIPQEFPALSSISATPSSLAPVWSKRCPSTSDSKAVISRSSTDASDINPAGLSSPSDDCCDNTKPEPSDSATTASPVPPVDSGSQLSPADDVLDIEEGVEEVDVYANLTVDNEQEAAALNPDDELERLGIQDEDLEEKFEFDTRFNPVVIPVTLTEQPSTEISFGFDVNEELVSHSVCEEGTGTPTLDTPGPDGSLAIDTMDGAIISFGANGGVNGVPTPFGMVTDANYDPVVLQMNRDMLSTSLCREESVDAVSPESGISSASPRSWQSPHHLDLDQSQASPSLQQPGSYPRTAKPQDQSMMQQVNDSLEKWSRSSSPDFPDRSVSSGWESRICASVEEEAGGREENVSNYSEIVSFLQNNWQAYSKEKKLKMSGGDKKQRR